MPKSLKRRSGTRYINETIYYCKDCQVLLFEWEKRYETKVIEVVSNGKTLIKKLTKRLLEDNFVTYCRECGDIITDSKVLLPSNYIRDLHKHINYASSIKVNLLSFRADYVIEKINETIFKSIL